ncbi:MAG: winged helix-turn-helix domain-containing protein [Actinobacteria bacterium]|nr:winged helix-turn-helix domain-containing protein [Actinomycetota bacterium]
MLDLGPPQQRAVLALLLIRLGEVVSAGAIVDAMWRESPPGTAANLVQGYVSGLRKVLGRETIVTRGGGYVLDVPAERLDARRFEELLAVARRAVAPAAAASVLREGLALWRGPALADFADAEFAQTEIRRLEASRRAAVDDRIDADLACGRHGEVLAELEALVADEPFAERAWRQLALACYRAGRQADALQACRRARALLGEELGIDPGPQLAELEQAILRQDPTLDLAAAPVAVTNLPTALTPFVGRQLELVDLAERLASARLVTLTGPGGCGKTRLATEAAARMASAWREGVWFVDLAPVATGDRVVEAVARALGVRGESGEPLTERLVSYLRMRRVLLVVDNCEQVIEASAGLVTRLLQGCPDVTVLATSREALGVPGEVRWPVPPLGIPPEDEEAMRPIEALSHDGVQLFVERATAAFPGFAPDREMLGAVSRICRRLDGLPLAIELAAARMTALSPHQLADRLDDLLGLLGQVRPADARHRTMRATLAWSWQLLDEGERTLLRRLAVFPGGCSLAAAEAMLADHDVERTAPGALVLGRLVDKSLMMRMAGVDGEPRYRMSEVVRQYALERLADAGEDELARRRCADVLAGFARRCLEEFDWERLGASSPRWPDRVEQERDNLRSVLNWSFAAGEDELAAWILAGTGFLWFLRGPVGEAVAWHERALASPGDNVARSKVAFHLTHFAMVEGDFARARAAAAQLRSLAAVLDDQRVVVDALCLSGWAAWAQGDREAARRFNEDAIAVADSVGYVLMAAFCRVMLARLAHQEADLPRAAELADHALQLYRGTDEPLYLGVMLDARAQIARSQGDLDRAQALAEESLRCVRAFGYLEGVASALATIAAVARARGDLDAARQGYVEALDICHRLGHRAGVMTAVEGLARLATAAGSDRPAARLWGAAEALRDALSVHVAAHERDEHDRDLADLRRRLGAEEFEAAWAAGRRLGLEDAAEEAKLLAARTTVAATTPSQPAPAGV